MNAREFGNFSAWPLKELIEKERSFPVGDMRGAELKTEIDRRITQRNQRQIDDQHYSCSRVGHRINDRRDCQSDFPLSHLASLKIG